MTFEVIDGIKVWGDVQPNAVAQMAECVKHGSVADAALMADHHQGYSQPIGGVVAYREHVSPSGVGYDIACGNKAVRTLLTYGQIRNELPRIADEVAAQVQFGIGKDTVDADKDDHPLFEDDRWSIFNDAAGNHEADRLKAMARGQLGTVGSGNHYLDLFAEIVSAEEMSSSEKHATSSYVKRVEGGFITDASRVWIGVHFGSRGFGHKTATGFMNLARDIEFFGRAAKGEVNEEVPVLIKADSDLGQAYATAMDLAGDYAYAGRDYVVDQVLKILGTTADYEVHNHHNFAWQEEHRGEKLWVVRKGATPLHPGQESFIGGSMCDISVIVKGYDPYEIRGFTMNTEWDEGKAQNEQAAALFSTVHGAGRIMGRMAAKGKVHRKTGEVLREGKVKREDFNKVVKDYGIALRGADLDESPFVYRQLPAVLAAHENTLDILHKLRPVVVCMAGDDVRDPYKD